MLRLASVFVYSCRVVRIVEIGSAFELRGPFVCGRIGNAFDIVEVVLERCREVGEEITCCG
jgi:hypothetical protein